MEFWGVEVKAGQPLKVVPDNDQIIHISQASLGESKKSKGDEAGPLHVKFGDQKLVLGTLSSNKIPQISFDLVFEKEFELSHNWNGGSVYFIGYKSLTGGEDDFSDFDSESDEDIPMTIEENGKVGPAVPAKPASLKVNAVKKSSEKAKAAESAKTQGKESDDDGDSDEDDDDSDDDLDASDEEGSDSEDDSDDSDEDDEETPKKAQVGGKKRPNESASKTPDAKKPKLATPQKTDGKKGGHTATPHPAKQAGKTPASNKSPKSGGSISCKSCSKAFNSENALQAHTKAKHEGK